MNNPVIETQETNNEEIEVKRPVRNCQVELETLSEWELARMTSKTWSMEQD